MARGPMFPYDGSPTATAYTVDTSTNVMMTSQPNALSAVMPKLVLGVKQPGPVAPMPIAMF